MEQLKLSKQQRRDLNRVKKRQQSDSIDNSAPTKKAKTAGSSVYKRVCELPPNEYVHPKAPRDRFVVPSDEVYNDLLGKCYNGFQVESSEAYSKDFHETFRNSLRKMDSSNLFQYDFTQPAGLNTKITKTLVSRCLVGQAGITYKYLGIRMFSHPWEGDEASPEFKNIKLLNDQMVERTNVLLKKSGRRAYGDCSYNLTLINKCLAAESGSHKEEPMFSQEKLSVSWHADSSLEHFSSIGVYHFVTGQNEYTDESWKVALRVQHYSEGPSHGKKAAGNAALCTVPPVAVPLPSQFSYYLLDDFNHHHQHSVIEGNSERYASTHRVSRIEGHCYQYIVSKCRNVAEECISAQAKHIRGLHLACSELEFEWIRQFFVQGSLHFQLHPWWTSRMDVLTGLWVELRSLCKNQMDILSSAACAPPDLSKILDKKERKKMTKKVKKMSLVTIESYEAMTVGLADTLEKRRGWFARESELRALPPDLRPMKMPIQPERFKEMEDFIRAMGEAQIAFSSRS